MPYTGRQALSNSDGLIHMCTATICNPYGECKLPAFCIELGGGWWVVNGGAWELVVLSLHSFFSLYINTIYRKAASFPE